MQNLRIGTPPKGSPGNFMELFWASERSVTMSLKNEYNTKIEPLKGPSPFDLVLTHLSCRIRKHCVTHRFPETETDSRNVKAEGMILYTTFLKYVDDNDTHSKSAQRLTIIINSNPILSSKSLWGIPEAWSVYFWPVERYWTFLNHYVDHIPKLRCNLYF